jgi:hypothetical protein
MCLPSSHAMHFGLSSPARLTDAEDLVIVIESDVPWIPHLHPAGCRARISANPSHVRYPMR